MPLNDAHDDDLRRLLGQGDLMLVYGAGTQQHAHHWVESVATRITGLPIRYETRSIGFKGKPSLADRLLEFNLSHTQQAFLIGFSLKMELGVDLEQPLPSENLAALADYAFSLQERSLLHPLDDTDSFLRIWTMKEAYLKATGLGLVDNLPQLSVVSAPDFAVSDQDYSSFQFCCPGGETASVVYKGAEAVFHFYVV